jgi:hypothetical protein
LPLIRRGGVRRINLQCAARSRHRASSGGAWVPPQHAVAGEEIYAGDGCAQMIFIENDEVRETSYRDRDGEYRGQAGVRVPGRASGRRCATGRRKSEGVCRVVLVMK